MQMTSVTHEQAMACLTCGLAGRCPPNYFPQEPGLWDQPCPQCGHQAVWITEPSEKNEPGEEEPMTDEHAAEILASARDIRFSSKE